MAEARAVAIEARTPRQLLLFAMAASLLWKLQALALPPHGEHAWRDADGLASRALSCTRAGTCSSRARRSAAHCSLVV